MFMVPLQKDLLILGSSIAATGRYRSWLANTGAVRACGKPVQFDTTYSASVDVL